MSGGICGIIANDSARYTLFSSCTDRLTLPEGWRKEWLIGGDWCGARNTLCEMTLESGADYLWFMDDDHAFPADILVRLLAHGLPLVTPICLTRTNPFAPVAFTERVDEHTYLPIYLPEQNTSGLVKLEGGGTAGMLIRRDVLEAVEPPWFEYGFASEDLLFCQKAIKAGFEIYADLSIKLGHITTAVVWPTVHEGAWAVGLTVGRDYNVVAAIAPRESE